MRLRPAYLLFVAVGTAGGIARADDTPPSARPVYKPIDAEVTSDTQAQFYEIRSPSGQTLITRRRLTSTLGVAVYDILDKTTDPMAPTLTFRARLRYDADYGGSTSETDIASDRFIPGFSQGPVDLMYAYLEGRRFLNGILSFRIGRQYTTDALGWWSFDGGLVKATTPYYFAVEAYGGLEQRGGLPLSTPRFERDGVWRGDRTDYDAQTWPSFQPNDIAPAYGAAIETAGFQSLHGRLSYRRVYNTGSSNTSEFANGLREPTQYSGTRISQERLGYSFDGTLDKLGGLKGGIVYDLYAKQISNIYASLDWFTSSKLTMSLDYDYYMPTFDADSIWNFFMAMPMNDIGLRATWDPTRRLGLSGGVRGRAFTVTTGPEQGLEQPTVPNGQASLDAYPSNKLEPMGGANFAARYRTGEATIGTRGSADFEQSGDRIGFDVYGERTFETRYVLQARTGVWQWNDKLRPDRDAASFSYVLGAGYKLFPRSMVLADFQHDMNRLSGQRFRAMVWLTLALSK